MSTRTRRWLPAVAFAALFFLSLFLGMALGSVLLSPSRILAALRGEDRIAAVILFQLRLPRVLAAALAGAGLAVAGCLLQTVTDNDLCAPNIVGVNAGAGLAVMLMLSFCPLLWRLQPAAAFVGALASTALVLSVSLAGGRMEQKTTVVLAGVAVSALLNAGISFLSLRYPDALPSYTAFSVGGFSGVRLEELTVPAVMIAVGVAAAITLAPKTELLCLGDDGARALGVPVRAVRTAAVLLASALCAAVVSFAGLLGFVGLIVPHLVRRLAGGTLRFRLAISAVAGATLTLFADLAGRTLFTPGELPAGIFLALLGAPFFIFLLIRKRGGHAGM